MSYLISKKQSLLSNIIFRNIISECIFYADCLMIYSKRMFLAQLVFLLYIVKNRLSFLQDSIRSVSHTERKIAWCNSESACVVRISVGDCFKDIDKISHCMTDVLCNIRNFYLDFLSLHVLLWITGASVGIFVSTKGQDFLYMIYFSLWNMLINILLVALIVNIQRESDII